MTMEGKGMGRYCPFASHGFLLLILLPSLLLFHHAPVTASPPSQPQLSSTQEAIMMNISSVVGDSRFNTSLDPCNWNRVSCTRSGSSWVVTSITLSNYGISDSTIFASICRLETLQSLDLSRNALTDLSTQFFPASCSMKEGLRLLNLSTNQATSYVTRSAICRVSDSWRFTAGAVPTSMVDSLVELVLSSNQLIGLIPYGLFRYENLTMLDLSQNNLTGPVPDEFKNLTKLETLLLSENRLSGEIPASLLNVTTLFRFAANQNNFTGLVPSWITKRVRMLDLSYNNLNGTIPSDFLSHLGLQCVDLTNNHLEGPIPSSLSGSFYRLRLGGNRLVGSISNSICNDTKLAYLELDNNQLTGSIPSELGKCNSLSLLSLASNKLQGPVPAAISNLEKLVVLKLQNNSLSGPIPDTFPASLSILNLSQNSFSGGIPSEIFKLPKLLNLYLQGNKINGSIPVSISSSESLIELNLGDNALDGIIPTMPNTASTSLLNLSHNHLSGPIPSSINSLSELEILDLSHNNLSGEVPSSLGGLPSLTQLMLSNNNLSGSLPRFGQNVEIDIEGNPDLLNGTRNNDSTSTISKKKTHTVVIIVFTIAVALVGLCVLAVVVITSSLKRIHRVEDERRFAGEGVSQVINGRLVMNSNQTSATELTNARPDNWHITTFQALHFEVADIPHGLTEENLIGSGGSGHVYRVTYTNQYSSSTGVVAVKQIQSVAWMDEKLLREFESEASILCNIRHRNIVKLLCCLSSAESKLLVYDYMDNGSLDRWLHGSVRSGHSMESSRSVQHVPLDWPTRLIVAVGAAQGLCYMHHECSPPIVHRDVKASNILLDSEFRAKVADFGVARMLVRAGEPNTMSGVAGSFGYMAPECAYTRKVDEKVDVYGFGVVLLEITTGRKANDGGEHISLAQWAEQHYRSGGSIPDATDISIRYAGYTDEIETVFKLGVKCTGNSPSSRPTMKDVLQILLKCCEQTLRKSRMEGSMEYEADPLLMP
ncbi:unnamed protein product [Urochloa decumbens]|uniref:Protein kinase domain-containing protein n=1 Tax=Urochloa decumbens TaxID=240449 RepID=A0ABC8W7N8_9POAL